MCFTGYNDVWEQHTLPMQAEKARGLPWNNEAYKITRDKIGFKTDHKNNLLFFLTFKFYQKEVLTIVTVYTRVFSYFLNNAVFWQWPAEINIKMGSYVRNERGGGKCACFKKSWVQKQQIALASV